VVALYIWADVDLSIKKGNYSDMNKLTLLWLIFFPITISLLGCSYFEEGCLSKAERVSEQLKECKVHQSLHQECQAIENMLEQVELRCEVNGIQESRVTAAIALGKSKVTGELDYSQYHRIKYVYSGLPGLYRHLVARDAELSLFSPKKSCRDIESGDWFYLLGSRYQSKIDTVGAKSPETLHHYFFKYQLPIAQKSKRPCMEFEEDIIMSQSTLSGLMQRSRELASLRSASRELNPGDMNPDPHYHLFDTKEQAILARKKREKNTDDYL